MASKDISMSNMAPKPTENSPSISSSAPPRKYGAHAGLKFNFNFTKDVMTKSFTFERQTEKGNVSTVTKHVVENQAYKGECIHSGTGYSASDLRVNVQEETDVCKTSIKNFNTDLYSPLDKPLRALQPRPLTSKCSNSRAHIASSSSAHIASSSGAQIASSSGAQIASSRGAQIASSRGAHIASSSGAHIASSSGAHIASSSGAHIASSSGAHIASSSSSVHSSRHTLKLLAVTSKTSKQPPMNVRQLSKTKEIEEPSIQATGIKTEAPPRKYGAHAGLKFNFNLKKDAMTNSFTFERQTEKVKVTHKKYGAHAGLKLIIPPNEKNVPVGESFSSSRSPWRKNNCSKNEKHTQPG